ncbi:MAG: DNA-3-methyladenine glycosylase 2 family protein [Calothrix sp. C42_A2020_038]|nr:DNA-3-methyladenine glycosylase 2 family protein [Calothrix sp. C42_A2020_038]
MLILQPLTEETITLGIQELVSRDNDLAKVIQTYGYPPNWIREKGFIGLIRIILGQQVSVASASAIFNKLELLVNPLTPENFITFEDSQLQTAGLSRQKLAYTRALAAAIASKQLDLDQLELGDEATLRAELTKIKGIGNWTVDTYLMMSLQRPDAFPASDLGVILAYQQLKDLPIRPTPSQLEVIAQKWRPWRALATRILWHYYLSKATKAKSI